MLNRNQKGPLTKRLPIPLFLTSELGIDHITLIDFPFTSLWLKVLMASVANEKMEGKLISLIIRPITKPCHEAFLAVTTNPSWIP